MSASNLKGIFYVLLASGSYGMVPFFALIAFDGGSNATTVILFRFLIAAIFLGAYLNIKKVDKKVTTTKIFDIALYGALFYVAAALSLVLSYYYIPTGTATVLHFVYPASVVIIMVTLFKEKILKEKIFCLLLSIAGVVLLANSDGGLLDPYGIFLGLISGVLYAVYIVAAGQGKLTCSDAIVSSYYLTVSASAILLIYGFLTNGIVLNLTPMAWGAMAFIAIFSTAISLILFLKGVGEIGASNAAILSTMEPIISVVIGVLLLGESLNFSMASGTLLVLMSVGLLTLTEKRKKVEVPTSL
ncbi:DMT family transporter [Methanococcus voltae]|uniref:Drug/metabolite transporter (DMT)-like permease n=1 Tax=Methanococcus voltae PS TaxID=523842 RepID=A0ABT2EVW3_METVO|nr:DMT family transporter [Methanococcus voltae]MBP2173009.1 drug/metabolite transporter (DMT)-like permease [Methanococcus voltae]MCS3922099.1 drug/metabolite transporter (DMT)-like permease [Methanococcus voltae PS]